MCWEATPPTSGNTVRRLSCRPTTSPNANPSATPSTHPDNRNTTGRLYTADPGSNRFKNHNRRCANDNGTPSGRTPARIPGRTRTPVASATRTASPATDGASNTTRTGSSTPSPERTRLTNRVASSESPPNSKNESSTPTASTPKTSQKIPHRISSTGVRGPLPHPDTGSSGAGNAARSSFPLRVTGNSSNTTTAEGTMYSGSASPANLRTSPASRPAPTTPVTYATSRRSPGRSSRATTATAATPGCRAITASTSPGSIRNPRTFTWKSTRPR